MIKLDREDIAKVTAKGDDVIKQGAKEVKKPDTIDSQKIIREKKKNGLRCADITCYREN